MMAVEEEKSLWSLCKMPFWQPGNASSSSTTSSNPVHSIYQQNQTPQLLEVSNPQSSSKVSSMAKSLLPTRRRLRLDPPTNLYFPYEPGKQVRSAIGIKNTSRSHVAFKFQTTAPKSCYMRPPGGILAPNESVIATVFKFVEPPENNVKPLDQKSRVKFKIMSLKVKGEMDYVPELSMHSAKFEIFMGSVSAAYNGCQYFNSLVGPFESFLSQKNISLNVSPHRPFRFPWKIRKFDEQKDQVAIEQILRVIFLDPERPNPVMEKLKRQLAEAEAALEVHKKTPEEAGPRIVGEGLVIDEWKERRERYLARQQVGGVDSV